ncbi:MAG TPA: glycerophosphodiester phosphodiesterase [Polyangia bacterium]|jgi:glycerophosphoryl diester phosphodiesterase|nr:glycerophosphodiester phosphodiesterase [Polyangia bacterium]
MPLVIAHRGASAEAPENSLLAFRRARELGADGVELDVMRCGSGEVVVFHDDDLWRLGGRPGAIRSLPLAALREIDLGGGARIPTLAEALEEIGPELLVNVELKAPERRGLEHLAAVRDEGLAVAVAEILQRAPRAERFIVSSFDPFLLGRFRRISPRTASAYLFHHQLAYPLRAAWPAALLKPVALHPEVDLVTAQALRQWHRAGYAVNVWTVDDAREIAWLAALGVDGIITNRPGEARRALERLGADPIAAAAIS